MAVFEFLILGYVLDIRCQMHRDNDESVLAIITGIMSIFSLIMAGISFFGGMQQQ